MTAARMGPLKIPHWMGSAELPFQVWYSSERNVRSYLKLVRNSANYMAWVRIGQEKARYCTVCFKTVFWNSTNPSPKLSEIFLTSPVRYFDRQMKMTMR